MMTFSPASGLDSLNFYLRFTLKLGAMLAVSIAIIAALVKLL